MLARAHKAGLLPQEICRQPVSTIADSIASELPRDRAKALRAVRQSGGGFVTVSDEAILRAIPLMAQLCGVFAEPAAAATFAGLERARQNGMIQAEESVCLLSTGNGLKDIDRARDSVSGGLRVAANIASVRTALASAGML